TVRTPELPSEYSIRRTAEPLALALGSPMLSMLGFGVDWRLANCQLTSPVTVYVPLPPLEAVHVPPPVAALDPPPLAGATKVPDPVSVIVSPPFAAVAEACPPGLMGPGGLPPTRLMMSQRTC